MARHWVLRLASTDHRGRVETSLLAGYCQGGVLVDK